MMMLTTRRAVQALAVVATILMVVVIVGWRLYGSAWVVGPVGMLLIGLSMCLSTFATNLARPGTRTRGSPKRGSFPRPSTTGSPRDSTHPT